MKTVRSRKTEPVVEELDVITQPLGDGGLKSLEAAQTSLRVSSWALGIATAALLGLGVVVVVLILRKKPAAAPALAESVPPRVIEREVVREVPKEIIREIPVFVQADQRLWTRRSAEVTQTSPVEVEVSDLKETFGQGNVMRTIMLPAVSKPGSEAVRIATGSDKLKTIIVRAISPIGSYAILSFSAAELNTPGIENVPTGDTFLLVAGYHQEIKLSPKQALYGKGSVDGVVISVVDA